MSYLLCSIFSLGSLLCVPYAYSSNAEVTLTQGNRLTGELTSMDSQGNITLHSPLSPTALQVTQAAIVAIEFDESTYSPKHSSELVHLHNGDTVPCSLLSLDNSFLKIQTWFAKDFTIAKNELSAIDFQRRANSILYAGPTTNDLWETNDSWVQVDNTLQCAGKGEVARSIELTENFILSSTITWQSSRPIFTLHFCADANQSENMQDTYALEFTTNSVHLIRSSKSQQQAKIGEIPLRIRELPINKLDIELRVDRRTQTIAININGQHYGLFDDTFYRVPIGNFIHFESKLQQNTDRINISDIKVLQWTGSNLSTGIQSTGPEDEHDTLIDTQGLEYTGDIIETTGKKKTLHFGIKHSNKPMVVPLSQIKSLHFANNPPPDRVPPPIEYTISLQGGGSLTVNSVKLSDQIVTANHSSLGEMHIKLSSLQKITLINNSNE